MTAANISVSSPTGLVSILIPCCGMLEYTKLCVPAVLRCSPETVELIFIGIGSLDGTAEYLAGLRDGLADRIRVEVCRAAINDDISAMQRFAQEFHRRDPGKWIQVDRLGGFCLLIRRSVLDRIGSKLDEWTNLSLFDTDIHSVNKSPYCSRREGIDSSRRRLGIY